MRRRLLVYLLSVAFVVAATASCTSAADVIDLRICDDPATERSWKHSSVTTISRILAAGSKTEIGVRRAPCNPTMPDSSCSAGPGAMFCRQSSLDRIQTAAAWLAVQFVDSASRNYEEFRLRKPEVLKESFRFADGAIANPKILLKVEALRTSVESDGPGGRASPDKADSRAGRIQARIAAYGLAALIGHESYHVAGDRCPVAGGALLEESGLFEHVLAVQTSDRLFCPSAPDPNEVKADRCAMRHLAGLRQQPLRDQRDEAFARRAAADVISFQAVFGFRRFEELPRGRYTVIYLDQYLRPSLRLLSLAAAVQPPVTKPRVCGESAALFVHAVQEGYKKCAGKGDVSDELLAMLPRGVERSWNGEPWTPNSFRCSP